ncbi:MAG: SBBP repeat-containing protein [Phycisphaeraceae bacterium]|nr:SBBP repeat-containing protein [Phycisphaeraceae bacterium]
MLGFTSLTDSSRTLTRNLRHLTAALGKARARRRTIRQLPDREIQWRGLETLEPRLLLSASLYGVDAPDDGNPTAAIELFNLSPALFVENRGQWADESVRYLHQGDGANIAMTDSGPVFQVFRTVEAAPTGDSSAAEGFRDDPFSDREPPEREMRQFSAGFVGAATVTPIGLEQSDAVFNYYLGDAENHRSDVPGYEIVAYEGLYDGIDLHMWGQRSNIKYEFLVAPGSDWTQIQVRYEGIEGLAINDAGELVVDLGEGWDPLVDAVPYVYQEIDGERVEVESRYVLVDEWTYSFELGDYDADYLLVIDPELVWSNYLGGSGNDYGYGIAVDGSGNTLVTGRTTSTSFLGAIDTNPGGWSSFISNVAGSGTLRWSTFLGGDGEDFGWGIAVDGSGNAFVAGSTSSTNLAGATNTYPGGSWSAFVAKLIGSGTLAWSAYLGGSGRDWGGGIMVDGAGNALVAGYTESTNFAGASNSNPGGRSAFVAKVTGSGTLDWSAYLGGSSDDIGQAVAVDWAGNAVVTGYTQSTSLPAANNTHPGGGWSAFVAKMTGSGTIAWSTYLGGSGTDYGEAIAVDGEGNALVTGFTQSGNFMGANNTYPGGGSSFVSKVTRNGTLAWSTYLGGSGTDYGEAIAVDGAGNALVSGWTSSTSLAGASNTNPGNTSTFVSKVTGSGTLVWSTYLGGSGEDRGYGISVDGAGNALVTGVTNSSSFAGTNNTYPGGSQSAFVAKIGTSGGLVNLPDLAVSPANVTLSPEAGAQQVTAVVRNLSATAAQDVIVRFRDVGTGTTVGTQTISTIAGWGSETVSVLWTPAGPGASIEVQVDPWDQIAELREDNNTATAIYGNVGDPPSVLAVSAAWDGIGSPRTFGRYISGVDLWNTFSADVVDPDGAADISHVTFSLGSLGTITDSNPQGGWTASFNMGALTGDTTLEVVAYDYGGNASDPWTGTVRVIDFPVWLGTPDGNDVFKNGQYHLSDMIAGIDVSHVMDSDVWLIGGTTSSFAAGLRANLTASLNPQANVSVNPAWVLDAVVFNGQVYEKLVLDKISIPFNENIILSASASLLLDGHDLSLTGVAGTLALEAKKKWTFNAPPQVIWVPISPAPVTVATGVSVELSLKASVQVGWDVVNGTVQFLDGTYLEPSITGTPYLFGGIGVPGFAAGLEVGGQLGAHYRASYDSVDGFSQNFWGSFQLYFAAVAMLGRRLPLVTWNVPNDGPWTFGNPPGAGQSSLATLNAQGSADAVVWAQPHVAADPWGNVLIVRAMDSHPDPETVHTDIFYAIRNAEGTWSPLSPVAQTTMMDGNPIAGFTGTGGAVAAWVANTLDDSALQTTPWNEALQSQAIYASYWNGSEWLPPQAVTTHDERDGAPSVAFHNGAGLLVWDHTSGPEATDLTATEIFYAVWDDTTHTWSAPQALTDNSHGDWAPQVAFAPDGTAMAVWVHAENGDATATTIRYATWDGTEWSTPATAPIGLTAAVREPQIGFDSTGRAVLAWITNEGGGDLLQTMIRDNGIWASVETVEGTPHFMEGLALAISNTDQAKLTLHGWDGEHDLFATTRDLTGGGSWTPPARLTDTPQGEWMVSTAFDAYGTPISVWADEDATTAFGSGADGIELALAPNLKAELDEMLTLSGVEGETVWLQARVSNVGWAMADATTATFYIGDPDAGGIAIGDPVAVSALPVGASTIVLSNALTLPGGENEYFVVVEPVAGEMMVGDNQDVLSFESLPPDTQGPQVMTVFPSTLPVGMTSIQIEFDEPVLAVPAASVSLVEEVLGSRPPSHVYLAPDRQSVELLFVGGLAPGNYTFKLRDTVVDLAGNALDGNADGQPGGDFVAMFAVQEGVAARHVFYNNSSFDGGDPGPGSHNDAAIAADKTALLPGEAVGSEHVSGYSRGINGIMVDIVGLVGELSLADFAFHVQDDGDPSQWSAAPDPLYLSVREGDGIAGSDRVEIIWADNAIQDTWLQVTVLATGTTGLAEDDVFYFGHLTGDVNGDGIVDDADLALLQASLGTSVASPSGMDLTGDGRVGLRDSFVLLESMGRSLDMSGFPVGSVSEPEALWTQESEPLMVTAQLSEPVNEGESEGTASPRILVGRPESLFEDRLAAEAAFGLMVAEQARARVAGPVAGAASAGMTNARLPSAAVLGLWDDPDDDDLDEASLASLSGLVR